MNNTSVLLIDDDEDTNFINDWILRKSFTQNISITQSGEKALDLLIKLENEPETLPDLIFLDIQMPEMNGFEFLEKYCQLSDIIRDKCKIIMLSSSFDKRDVDLSLKNKYVIGFLNKPLNIEDLKKIIN